MTAVGLIPYLLASWFLFSASALAVEPGETLLEVTGEEKTAAETDFEIGVLPTSEQLETVVPGISEQEEEFLNESATRVNEAQPVEATATAGDTLDSSMIVEPFSLLGELIYPGSMKRLPWVASETLYGSNLDTPVYVIHGSKPGLTLCLTAAIHGDELNGVEIVRQTMNRVSAQELSGTLIGVPIVNLLGFTRGTRYLPDRRDLNRYFPGKPSGSSASRIAYSFFEEIIRRCDRLVDLHTGSLNRTNMPQLRANLEIPEILEFTSKFGSTAVLHSSKLKGNLRAAATNVGVPAVALELGEPGTLQKKHIKDGVKIIKTLLSRLEMTKAGRVRSEPQPVYYRSRWVRVNNGGLLTTEVKVGARIRKGTVLGTLINPLSNETFEVVSPYNGRLLGMALNQFMLPGYAAFNIGLVEDEPEAIAEKQGLECSDDAEGNANPTCGADEEEEIQGMEINYEDTNGSDEPEPH